MHTVFLMAQPPGGPGGQQANPLISMMPLILMFVVLYFLMIRPQQQKAKEHKKMLETLHKGDKVVTSGGICGIVVNIKENNIVTVKIADGVKVDFVKSSITQVEKGSEAAEV